MTLQELLETLEEHDGSTVLRNGFGRGHSYRGRYEEIAFEPAENVTIASMLAHARSCVGATFRGYKGGFYTMYPSTRVNVAGSGEWGGDEDALTTWRLNAMLATKVKP